MKVVERDFSALTQRKVPPAIYGMTQRADGLTEFFMDGPNYEGNPTRIYAIYGYPETPLSGENVEPGKAPAIVLVHGGGGSAFAEWVQRWNDAGFAAIAIATEGQVDKSERINNLRVWERHAYSGPRRQGLYLDSKAEITDQWMYHAVSATLLANNYLRSQDNISVDNIGIMGVSWGGIITSTVIGYDQRFDFAIPTYGIGYLSRIENKYGNVLGRNKQYQAVWEPAKKFKNVTMPTLWLTNANDKHFPLNWQMRSYQDVSGDVAVSIPPNFRHGHPPAWERPESYDFARSVVLDGKIAAKPVSISLNDDGIADARLQFNPAAIEAKRPVSATIHYTMDSGYAGHSNWVAKPAMLTQTNSAAGLYSVTFDGLPNDTTRWFINVDAEVVDGDRPVVVSSGLCDVVTEPDTGTRHCYGPETLN
ncbi:MAG: alpha/beta hydrolase family protein [Litorimonas sp.]